MATLSTTFRLGRPDHPVARALLAVTIAALALCVSRAAAAAVPMELTYRGTLEDTNGPFTGTVGMIFELCDAASAGSCPWSEGHTVNVQDGRFAVSLGGSTPIPDTLLTVTPELYLAIEIDGTPMVGRQKLQATAFTRRAAWADWADRAVDGVPAGAILMWTGDASDVPIGWALCNGSNGTPDLRNRFLVAAGGAYGYGATGGSYTSNGHALTRSEMPPHRHLGSAHVEYDSAATFHDTSGSSWSYGYRTNHTNDDYVLVYSHVTGGPCSDTAGKPYSGVCAYGATASGGVRASPPALGDPGSAHSHGTTAPPYYALAFIMKL